MDSDSHLVIWVWVSLWSLLTSLLGRPQLRLPVITHFLCGSPLCQKHIRIGPTLIPHRKGNILSYPQADPTVSTVCSEKYDGPNVLRMLCKGTSGAYDILILRFGSFQSPDESPGPPHLWSLRLCSVLWVEYFLICTPPTLLQNLGTQSIPLMCLPPILRHEFTGIKALDYLSLDPWPLAQYTAHSFYHLSKKKKKFLIHRRNKTKLSHNRQNRVNNQVCWFLYFSFSYNWNLTHIHLSPISALLVVLSFFFFVVLSNVSYLFNFLSY